MASQHTSETLIADRYASALYELSSDNKCIDRVLNDLKSLDQYITNSKDLKLLIRSPLIKSEDKQLIFEKILQNIHSNKLTSNFIKTISRNRRFANLPNIINRFFNINSEKRGEVQANITSADELSETQKELFHERLRTILGDKISLNYKVDKKIIGGLIIKVGSKMIDSSISNKISQLKIAMKGA